MPEMTHRRRLTKKARLAISEAQKRRWAKVREEQAAQAAAETKEMAHYRYGVRILSTQDGLDLSTFEINSWGELVDILTNKYNGIPINEVSIYSNE